MARITYHITKWMIFSHIKLHGRPAQLEIQVTSVPCHFNVKIVLRSLHMYFNISSYSNITVIMLYIAMHLRHGRINVSRHDRVCQFCLNRNVTMVEDEYHFVMECPLYSHIRAQLLGNSVVPTTQHTFHELMKTNSIVTLTRLACYTYHGLNIHKHFNDL